MFFYSRLDHRRSRKRRSEARQKLEGRFIITEVGPDGEPIAPEATAKKIHKTIWMYCQGSHPDQLQAMESFQSKRETGCGTRKRKRMVLAGA